MSIPSTINSTGAAGDVIGEIVRQNFPFYVPRSNYDILALACGTYEGPKTQGDIEEFIDNTIRTGTPDHLFAAMRSRALACANGMMAVPAEEIIGIKPRRGDPSSHIRPIPDSDLSIRLWPLTSPTHRAYCLDFVLTHDETPVNVPDNFELYAEPTSFQPFSGRHRVRSLEAIFWTGKTPIPAGTEKFMLAERTTCVLVRPGKNEVTFTIPLHPTGVAESQQSTRIIVKFSD